MTSTPQSTNCSSALTPSGHGSFPTSRVPSRSVTKVVTGNGTCFIVSQRRIIWYSTLRGPAFHHRLLVWVSQHCHEIFWISGPESTKRHSPTCAFRTVCNTAGPQQRVQCTENQRDGMVKLPVKAWERRWHRKCESRVIQISPQNCWRSVTPSGTSISPGL